MEIFETKVVTFYANKIDKKTKKKTSIKVTAGIVCRFNDVARDLTMGQEVLIESAKGTLKPYKVHGTRVFRHKRFGTYSVTMPCQPKRNKAGGLEYQSGKIIVLPPTKNGGLRDASGMSLERFRKTYSASFVNQVVSAIDNAGTAHEEIIAEGAEV